MAYWLMKSEPDVFSFADLTKRKGQREKWDGVRNYQARNFMMNEMNVGDIVLFYHSSSEPPGIAGLAEVVEAATPDETSWDPKSEYYDPKSSRENPRWWAVTVGKPKPIQRFITLAELKTIKELKDFRLLQKGQRLSIMPVSKKEFEIILNLTKR